MYCKNNINCLLLNYIYDLVYSSLLLGTEIVLVGKVLYLLTANTFIKRYTEVGPALRELEKSND